ncbi:MAG: hypothetical protein LW832_07710 [Parachlamydia sp.]|nr:hypothetical protein [Parachlamydia sp.]
MKVITSQIYDFNFGKWYNLTPLTISPPRGQPFIIPTGDAFGSLACS